MLGFIEDIVSEKCNGIESFCDIFAGTGVVGERFNKPEIKIISNDFLFSNYVCLKAFLGTSSNVKKIADKIDILNNLKADRDNYFSECFGNTYFSLENARKIGAIREEIEKIFERDYNTELMILKIDLIIKLFHLLTFSLLLKNTLKAKLSLEILEKVN